MVTGEAAAGRAAWDTASVRDLPPATEPLELSGACATPVSRRAS